MLVYDSLELRISLLVHESDKVSKSVSINFYVVKCHGMFNMFSSCSS